MYAVCDLWIQLLSTCCRLLFWSSSSFLLESLLPALLCSNSFSDLIFHPHTFHNLPNLLPVIYHTNKLQLCTHTHTTAILCPFVRCILLWRFLSTWYIRVVYVPPGEVKVPAFYIGWRLLLLNFEHFTPHYLFTLFYCCSALPGERHWFSVCFHSQRTSSYPVNARLSQAYRAVCNRCTKYYVESSGFSLHVLSTWNRRCRRHASIHFEGARAFGTTRDMFMFSFNFYRQHAHMQFDDRIRPVISLLASPHQCVFYCRIFQGRKLRKIYLTQQLGEI